MNNQDESPQRAISNLITNSQESPMKFIFKISWFESPRHRTSHTDMYFLNAKDTQWAFTPCGKIRDSNFEKGFGKVEYIMVSESSHEFRSAVQNSNISK